MMPVRLSVTFVHCGHRVRWIPDIFACLDRWMSSVPCYRGFPNMDHKKSQLNSTNFNAIFTVRFRNK